MKNFLAVDTSGGYMSVVAAKDGEVFSSFTPDCAMKHSVLLMPKIEETLKKAQLRLDECDFFFGGGGCRFVYGYSYRDLSCERLLLGNRKALSTRNLF